jgi:DNA-binding protein H-NS
MQIQTVRTTLTMPIYIHKKLKKEALEKHVSFSNLLVQKILAKDENSIEQTLAEIRKISKRANTKNINYKELINHGRKY